MLRRGGELGSLRLFGAGHIGRLIVGALPLLQGALELPDGVVLLRQPLVELRYRLLIGGAVRLGGLCRRLVLRLGGGLLSGLLQRLYLLLQRLVLLLAFRQLGLQRRLLVLSFAQLGDGAAQRVAQPGFGIGVLGHRRRCGNAGQQGREEQTAHGQNLAFRST